METRPLASRYSVSPDKVCGSDGGAVAEGTVTDSDVDVAGGGMAAPVDLSDPPHDTTAATVANRIN